MTARADISNHRRKVLEERSEERGSFYERNEKRVADAIQADIDRRTAWEKGEAKPPFYREVLEEGVRRGDVVSREQVGRVVFDTTFDERQAVRKLCAELAAERQRALLAETKLREANAAAEFAQKQAEIAWAKLREAEERIEHARDFAWVTMKDRHHYSAEYALAQEFYSILAGTEKEDQ